MRPRTTLLVEGFQTQFVLTLLVWTAVLVVVLVLLLVGPIAQATVTDADDGAAATALLVLHDRLWLPLAVFFAGLALVAIRLTHRVAGPLYRFRRVFAEVGQGNLDAHTRIRQRDFLRQESEALDGMLRDLSGRLTSVAAAVEAADRELAAMADAGDAPVRVGAVRAHVREARATIDTFTMRRPPAAAPPTPASSAVPVSEEGFSIVELAIAMGIVTTLAALGVPAYGEALNRARVAGAIGDINAISKDIAAFEASRGCLPSSLAEVQHAGTLDPWGRPYEYAVPQAPGGARGGGRGGNGGSCRACNGGCVGIAAARKDRNLLPVNSDYDLYSKGRDGASVPPLTAGPSRDDIIRGRTGGFIGLVADY